jgi:polar amino acid transport system substrate-binding protein
VEGATADLAVALGQILGVEIEHTTIDGLASVLSGMQAQRYDLDLGPVGDFPERQEQATFVDWVQEYVVFAVQNGNPKGIVDIDSACGARIAVQAAGSAEKVIKQQSDACAAAGKPAIEVQSYKDQPSSILAVQSNRADAFFSSQAPLTYFVQQSGGQLELAGQGKPNGFGDLYQGAVVPKGSPLADVLLEAFRTLHENGTYEAIMTKWNLQGNMLPEAGINLGKA